MSTISTRAHGAIDYGVATLFGGLAASRSLPPAVRGVLGAAGVYHTGYALLTDYEAGVRPRFSMRQHLWLDALGGLALCAAGVAMTRQKPGARALLLAAGVAELAVVAYSRGAAEPWPRRRIRAARTHARRWPMRPCTGASRLSAARRAQAGGGRGVDRRQHACPLRSAKSSRRG